MAKKVFMMGKPEVFGGNAELPTNVVFYGESADFFAQTITNNLSPGSYSMADFGGAGGELCRNILNKLPRYTFKVDVFDTDTKALARNKVASRFFETDLASVPAENKSYDLTIMRYVLQWNLLNEQKSIISEIARVTRGLAVIQHCGPIEEEKDEWRAASENMINDTGIDHMKRKNYFYSSREEVETIFRELAVPYKCIQYRRIENYADIFVERYGLDDTDAKKVRDAIANKNHIMQVAWVLDFRK